MTLDRCELCGAANTEDGGPYPPLAGRSVWDWRYTPKTDARGKRLDHWTYSVWDGGRECLWYKCATCKGVFHTATYRDQFNKLSEPDAERAMQLFLSGNPPRRWVWFGWGVMAAGAAMEAMRWAGV